MEEASRRRGIGQRCGDGAAIHAYGKAARVGRICCQPGTFHSAGAGSPEGRQAHEARAGCQAGWLYLRCLDKREWESPACPQISEFTAEAARNFYGKIIVFPHGEKKWCHSRLSLHSSPSVPAFVYLLPCGGTPKNNARRITRVVVRHRTSTKTCRPILLTNSDPVLTFDKKPCDVKLVDTVLSVGRLAHICEASDSTHDTSIYHYLRGIVCRYK